MEHMAGGSVHVWDMFGREVGLGGAMGGFDLGNGTAAGALDAGRNRTWERRVGDITAGWWAKRPAVDRGEKGFIPGESRWRGQCGDGWKRVFYVGGGRAVW